MLICEVLAVTVRLARLVSVVPKLKTVPLNVSVEAPKIIEREFALLDVKFPAVSAYPALSKLPFVISKVVVP